MKISILIFTFFAQAFLAVSVQAQVKVQQSSDPAIILQEIQELSGRHQSSKVWFVTDIDNTVIRFIEEAGSEPWFNDQVRLLSQYQKASPAERQFLETVMVATTMEDLIKVWETDVVKANAAPIVPEMPNILSTLNHEGVRLMALTARSSIVGEATTAQLRQSQYNFAHLTQLKFPANKVFSPTLSIDNLKALKLPETLVNQVASDPRYEPKDVLFDQRNNVYLTNGADKGVALVALIAALKPEDRPKAVFFMDNSKSRVDQMKRALEALGIEGSLLHFTASAHEEETYLKTKENERKAALGSVCKFLF